MRPNESRVRECIDVAAQGEVADVMKMLAPQHALHRPPGQGCLVLKAMAVAVERAVRQEQPEIELGEVVVAAEFGSTVPFVAAAGLSLQGGGENQGGENGGAEQGGFT